MVQMKRKIVFAGKSSQISKDFVKSFRENLVRLRKEAGLSQDDLARKAGLTHNYIWMLENGERQPKIDTIAALADALGLKSVGPLLESVK